MPALTADNLRKQLLDALPMNTQLETAWYYHLKDQPEKFWLDLWASYEERQTAAKD